MLIELSFNYYFHQSSRKLDVYSLLQILVTLCSANSIPWTRNASSAAWKRTTHLVCSSCKRKLEHVQTSLDAWISLTQHPCDTAPIRKLNCHKFNGGVGNYNTVRLMKFNQQIQSDNRHKLYLRETALPFGCLHTVSWISWYFIVVRTHGSWIGVQTYTELCQRIIYSTISAIRYTWDQSTAGLPKTTNYWEKSEKCINYI
jgi:hypothetical protein